MRLAERRRSGRKKRLKADLEARKKALVSQAEASFMTRVFTGVLNNLIVEVEVSILYRWILASSPPEPGHLLHPSRPAFYVGPGLIFKVEARART